MGVRFTESRAGFCGTHHSISVPHPSSAPKVAAQLETAVNGLWDAASRLGDRILAIGAGTLGCLVARLAERIPGCRVRLIDLNPSRAAIAAALGVGLAAPEETTPTRTWSSKPAAPRRVHLPRSKAPPEHFRDSREQSGRSPVKRL